MQLMHAAHAARSRFVAIIIVSEDTDILVVCLALKSHVQSSMFNKCSSQTTVKYLDVSRIVERTGASTCKSLLGFHTFTGCDTVTPVFQGRGKVLVFRIMVQIKDSRKYFKDLEENGSCPTSFTVTFRGSPVLCTARMRKQVKSTSCDTGSSAGRRGMLIPITSL